MKKKDITLVYGDTYDLGFRVARQDGPIDLTLPDTRLYANIVDLAGRRVVRPFQIVPTDLVNGRFKIHLSSSDTANLRGKYEWYVKWEHGGRRQTLAGGILTALRNP